MQDSQDSKLKLLLLLFLSALFNGVDSFSILPDARVLEFRKTIYFGLDRRTVRWMGHTVFCLISYHIISYHIISYHIISHLIISHIISYLFISYHIISYHIISYCMAD